jgi:hypothetical protein
MRLVVIACALAALGAQFGCGGDSSAPPAPTPLATRSITVTMPAGGLVVGDTQQATASATMSDGTTKALSTGFRSDVPSVATVTDAGMVTAVAAGRANIYLVSEGQQGTANIQVAPNYGGNWSGSYIVNSCSQTGDWASMDFCSTFTTGRVLPYNMSLTQKGLGVSGDFYIGAIPFQQVSATVGGGGELALQGSYVEETFTLACNWDLTSQTAGRLNGSLRQVWRDSEASGELIVTGTIRDSMKLAGGARSGDGAVAAAVQKWLQRKR